MRKSVLAAAVAALFISPVAVTTASAQAAKPASPHTFTGNVAVVSDYRFRGISQTYLEPAIQGGFDYSHASGFYFGNWNSSVSGNGFHNVFVGDLAGSGHASNINERSFIIG